MSETINDYIMRMTREGHLDPNCQTCKESFIPKLMDGHKLYDIFAPRHKASPHCKSGKHPHCTCDTCF